MFKPDKRLQKLYARNNKIYFDGQLPSDTQVGWKDMSEVDTVGLCASHDWGDDTASHTIYIDSNIGNWALVKMTLLHEMAHVKLHPYSKHGKKFNEEMLRLAVRGAFNGIW